MFLLHVSWSLVVILSLSDKTRCLSIPGAVLSWKGCWIMVLPSANICSFRRPSKKGRPWHAGTKVLRALQSCKEYPCLQQVLIVLYFCFLFFYPHFNMTSFPQGLYTKNIFWVPYVISSFSKVCPLLRVHLNSISVSHLAWNTLDKETPKAPFGSIAAW